MLELPEPLQKALDQQRGQPLPLVDPRTDTPYLLVRADLFERIQYADDEADLEKIDVGTLIAEAMREDDENDPTLDSYRRHKDGT